jgi:phosphotransferase system HPr-like phosphotransfer protein
MNTEGIITLNTIEKVKNFVNKIIIIDSDVDISVNRYVCDAKSIMALFSLNLSKPLTIKIHSDDEEEIKKFNEIVEEFK